MTKHSNQRANAKNPNNQDFKVAADNRSIQLNSQQIILTIPSVPQRNIPTNKKSK